VSLKIVAMISEYAIRMGFARLFRSRWAALFWSAGILWTAYDVADSAPAPAPEAASPNATAPKTDAGEPAPQDATGSGFDMHDLQILANAG
jgi:hypothetical protein